MAYSQNAKEIVETNQSDCNMNQTVSAGRSVGRLKLRLLSIALLLYSSSLNNAEMT